MKIVENKNVKTVEFGKLKIGDVFQTINSRQFYMKTKMEQGCNLNLFNTVHLKEGGLYFTENCMEVIPIDCELIVK